jgi:hypothetical protein
LRSSSRCPHYGTHVISNYMLDALLGVETLDGRLATRVCGAP